MHIVLREAVNVRINGSDNFHTFTEGTYVNYSCKKSGVHWVHKFVAPSPHGMLEYMTVTFGDENPSWL